MISLVGLVNLRELIFSSDMTLPGHNKFIQDPKYSRIKLFNLVPQLMGVDGYDRLGNSYSGSLPESASQETLEVPLENPRTQNVTVSDRNVSDKLEIIENYITNLSENVKQVSENSNNTQVLDQLSVLESQIKDLKSDKESQESTKRIDGMENILKELVGKLDEKEDVYLKEYVNWRENNIMVIGLLILGCEGNNELLTK
jgi:hypothetical protein